MDRDPDKGNGPESKKETRGELIHSGTKKRTKAVESQLVSLPGPENGLGTGIDRRGNAGCEWYLDRGEEKTAK